MQKSICTYCGKKVKKIQREHVFPSCLYPPSKSQSKVQRMTIPACDQCNNGWSDDEAHFRDLLVIAGDKPNAVRRELFQGPVKRSFEKADGKRRLEDLLSQMIPTKKESKDRYMVFPADDGRLMRVVKKAIRGLCAHHNIGSPVSEQRVWVDVLRYQILNEYFQSFKYHHREADIAEYWYSLVYEEGIESAWIIRFFETVVFIGLVSVSEQGFK